MPRHPFREDLHIQCRTYASLTAEYITELSYQTETNLVWCIMTKMNETLEHSLTPNLANLVAQIGEILKEGKRRLDRTRQLSDYVDVTVLLPNKGLSTSS